MDKKKNDKQRKKIVKEGFIWLFYLIVAAAFAWIFTTYGGQVIEVKGVSMKPSLYDGDKLYINKLIYWQRGPERFDIVVFPKEGQKNHYYIKRVIGLPGETVKINEDGDIEINGEQLMEYYGTEPMKYAGMAYKEILLKDDEYFVLGDNRNDSSDSRSEEIGLVKREQIIGRAVFRILPLDGFGSLKLQ